MGVQLWEQDKIAMQSKEVRGSHARRARARVCDCFSLLTILSHDLYPQFILAVPDIEQGAMARHAERYDGVVMVTSLTGQERCHFRTVHKSDIESIALSLA